MRSDGNGIGIVGLGVALPEQVRTNDYWTRAPERYPDLFGHGDPMRGTVERRVLEPERDSVDLEVEACRAALASCGAAVDDVRVMIGASGTPTWIEPGNHVRVARRLALPPATLTLSTLSACAVAVPQLEVGVRTLAGYPGGLALMYQSSVYTRTLDDGMVLAPLVGDGAVAEVLGPVPAGLGFVGARHAVRTEFADAIVVGRPQGRWYDAGERIVVGIDDREAARDMIRRSPELAAEVCLGLLSDHGLRPADVAAFV
ncbi:MAG: hypothetical protein R3F59_07615, partial [Myxococcota bacterium]